MKQYKVGLVGIGTVGTEMIKVLRERKFPCSEIRVLATRDRDQEIAGETFHVRETKAEAFDGLDIVLFAGTEGAKGASKLWGWEAVKRGAVVIDNSADFRQDDRVPLVIPEINAEALDKHQGFIASRSSISPPSRSSPFRARDTRQSTNSPPKFRRIGARRKSPTSRRRSPTRSRSTSSRRSAVKRRICRDIPRKRQRC